jgi:hypothetical protein
MVVHLANAVDAFGDKGSRPVGSAPRYDERELIYLILHARAAR